MTKSKKYTGVYHRRRQDGDITYYFTYQNDEKKTEFQKVGLKSQGIDEQYVYELRSKTILSLRIDETLPKIITTKKKYSIKVDDISEFYFSNHKTKTSQKRQRQYENRLKDYFGHKSIYNVNSEHIDRFREDMLLVVSEQTTIIYIELLSTIFNYFIKCKRMKLVNPVLRVKRPRIDNRRERFLSKDEINILYDEISDDFCLTLFVSLSLSTSSRKSTVLNYSIKDVDVSHKMINSYDLKNQSSYKSFLDDRCLDLVKVRMSQTDNLNDKLIYKDGINDLGRWISRSLKIVFDNLFNVGLDVNDRKNRVVIHTLRHTVLSHLGMKGCNQFLIKKISNHKSSSMVERYVKLSEDSGRKEIDNLWDSY